MAERERIARVLIEAHQNAPDDASVFYLMADALLAAREGADKPQWLCEFCYARLYVRTLPDSWEWVWQSAVCPECRVRVAQDGGYHVVKGGAYAEVPDPRPWTDLRDQLATATAAHEALRASETRLMDALEQAEARVLEVQRERDEMIAAHARALEAAGERDGAWITAMTEDAAGAPVVDLLLDVARHLYQAGGGPLEDRVRALSDTIAALLAPAADRSAS